MSVLSDIKIDLAEKFPHLPKAPIVEAAIEVRARAEATWEEGAVSQQLKSRLVDYPKVLSQKEIRQEFKLGLGKPSEGLTHDLGWKGLHFQSADGRHIAKFNRDGFVFSRLHPYENWEQFSHEATRLWRLYAELARPTEAQRIGLRFINRIDLPPQDREFEDYIQPRPELPQGLGLPFLAFFHQDTFAVPGHPYAVTVIRTVQPPQSPVIGNAGVILDIDVFTVQGLELGEEVLQKRLAEMRWLKNKAFFGSVTPKALEKFQ